MAEIMKASELDSTVAAMALTAGDDPQSNRQSGGFSENEIAAAIGRICDELDWSGQVSESFGKIVPRQARVLIKPNFVLHENQGPWGLDAVVTHPAIVRTVAEKVLQSQPSEVIVGDAPVQGCDFDRLMQLTGLGDWAAEMASRDSRFLGIRDFRRTACVFENGVRHAEENLKPEENYVLFDLGEESLLEPVTDQNSNFRVTCYDWRLLAQTHSKGRHRYLVAREVMEADVVINLPKLKTHKKAGITCALKNLVGINGNKEYLPHHRLGGTQNGGDCYPGGSLINRALEFALDRQNIADSSSAVKVWNSLSIQLDRARRLTGDKIGVEGSWSGNDTVWRMALDLNRILIYGRADGTLADTPQRRVIHIVDGLIAGQGDGPLSPEPLPLGLMMGGTNAAAIDWVGARLLGYDPAKIPIVRQAFGDFRWPVTNFAPDEVRLAGDIGDGLADSILLARSESAVVNHPAGWRNAAASQKDSQPGMVSTAPIYGSGMNKA